MEIYIYIPLTHPDLKDIPFFHSDRRLSLIKANLSVKRGVLLDIGTIGDTSVTHLKI